MCNSLARGAGITGTFVAWLSSSTTNAVDRVAGSRGWKRRDGQPVFDTISAAFSNGVMFNRIDLDETGASNLTGYVYTNTNSAGANAGNSCADWMSTTGTGDTGDVTGGIPYFSSGGVGDPCTTLLSLFCFQIGGVYVVQPQRASGSTGRIAFISSPRTAPGVAGLDAICSSDAQAAGLPGNYLAAVATSTSTIRSRFTVDSRPIIRVDGTVVAPDASAFFGGTDLASFVNQKADGTYVTGGITGNFALAWTGATDPAGSATVDTCINWTDMSANNYGTATDVGSAYTPKFWGGVRSRCDQLNGALCIAQ
jgi:hypothetical protein